MDLALTDKRQEYVRYYVSGLNQTESAKRAGYACPQVASSKLMREPEVQAAIQAEVIRMMGTEGMTLAYNTLINILKSDKVSASAKVDAARLVLNKGPLNDAAIARGYGTNDKPLAEMSLPELEAFIKGGIDAIEKAREQRALPAEFVDVTTQQTPDNNPK